MSIVVFRVKDIAPNSWRIRQNEVMAINPKKKDEGLKFIGYYKGLNSIFREELKNKDIPASLVPEFELNAVTGKTELEVNTDDKILYEYLTTHPDFGVSFEMYSEELESLKKLEEFKIKEKALEVVKTDIESQVRALAVVLFGFDYLSKNLDVLKAELKQRAFDDPKYIVDIIEANDYDVKMKTALAFSKGVVRVNLTNTMIIWGDNSSEIISIENGENAYEKLYRYLMSDTTTSNEILLELARRDSEVLNIEVASGATSISIEDARAMYLEKFEKEVPNPYKNNIDWIIDKLDL